MIYLKAFLLTITGLTGAVVVLLSFFEIPNSAEADIDVEKEKKIRELEKGLVLIFSISFVGFLFYSLALNSDLLRAAISMLILLVGSLIINYENSKTKQESKKYSLRLTGYLLFASGCLLFLNECIIIIVRWIVGINNVTFLEMIYWVGNFTFVNTYPNVDVYLEIFSISVVISVCMATTIVAKKLIKYGKINEHRMNEIEKKLENIKKNDKIKIIGPQRKRR